MTGPWTLVRSDHCLPFQRSALPPPTATQFVAEEHDTASRGTTLARDDHRLPFKRSVPAEPTAAHADSDQHDTPDSDDVDGK
jgi:hypothetical protein